MGSTFYMTVFFVALWGFFVLVALSVVMLFAGSYIQYVAIQTCGYITSIRNQIMQRKRHKQEQNKIMQQYGK